MLKLGSGNGLNMRKNKSKILILLIVLAAAVGLAATALFSRGINLISLCCNNNPCTSETSIPLVPKMPVDGSLSVYFIDVGQGDAALIVSPSGRTMLIDAGESIYANRVEKFLKELGIERIDVLVGTHSHSDHIGSMPRLIKKFSVGSYITTASDVPSVYSDAVETALAEKAVQIGRLRSGDTVDFDEVCKVIALSPVLGCEYSSSDSNDGCLILRVEYGETAFIFTADATVHAEQLSMFHNEKELFKAQVLKVAHHGSTTSSSLGFIETVGAELAVISVGASNPYGHPDFDIINRLKASGCSVVRTDERGTIAVFSDGKVIESKFQKP